MYSFVGLKKEITLAQSYQRPTTYTNSEWLSFIYHLVIGRSEIIKERKAPLNVYDMFLHKIPNGSNVLEPKLLDTILEYIKKTNRYR